MWSSVVMPFGECSTPAASRHSPSRLGILPVATRMVSAFIVSSLPLRSNVTPSEAIRFTADCMWNVMPCFSIVLRRRLAMSPSIVGRHSLRNSTIVTLLPKLLKIEANSIPMTPAPTITILSETWSSRSISVDVDTTLMSISQWGGILGFEPVAMIIFGAVCSSPFTTTV